MNQNEPESKIKWFAHVNQKSIKDFDSPRESESFCDNQQFFDWLRRIKNSRIKMNRFGPSPALQLKNQKRQKLFFEPLGFSEKILLVWRTVVFLYNISIISIFYFGRLIASFTHFSIFFFVGIPVAHLNVFFISYLSIIYSIILLLYH